MPNWCSTTYKVTGDLKEVKSLHKTIKQLEARKKSLLPNGFGKLWLGNLVKKLGHDPEKVRCRGEIIDYDLTDNVLSIYQETAWCEQEGVREAIEAAYPNLTVYYQAEESGCDVYVTNDYEGRFFTDKYFLDSSLDDAEYFDSIESLAKYVLDIVGHTVEPDTKALQEELDEYCEKQDNEDAWYNIHEFEIVD